MRPQGIADGLWSLHRPADTLFLELDDIRIIFQQAADKTHFLNQASAFILDFVAEKPAEFSAILNMLLDDDVDADPGQTASQATQLMQHLDRLERLGLVERRRPDR